jgi:hypothetical protein
MVPRPSNSMHQSQPVGVLGHAPAAPLWRLALTAVLIMLFATSVSDVSPASAKDLKSPTFRDISVTKLTRTSATVTWTLDKPAMGRLEYGPTTSYGRKTTKETSFDYTTHVQTIKGLKPGTRYHFRAISEDAAGNWAASRDRTFTTAGAPPRSRTAKPTPRPKAARPAPKSTGIYGPGIAMTSLSNSPIGGPANTNPISLRFRAERSGNLRTARIYIITDRNNSGRRGYSGGNGGRYQISIRPDDGSSANLPASTELAVETITPGTASNTGYVIRFDPAPRLVAGRLYHMVFKNVDPSPTRNWLSINHSYVHYGGGQRQPRWHKSDWAHLRMYRGSWQLRQDHAPILDLGFADGHHQGNGYMEMSYSDSTIGYISGSRQVGERFTMPRDEVATGASVRLQRVSGSAPLELRLKNSSGTTLGQGQVRAADIPLGPSTGLGERSKWVSTAFDRPVSLKAGQSYRLELSTAAGTQYATWVIREGPYYGYHPSTVFTDGLSQQSRNNGSSWSSLGRVSGANDLQFYLSTR